MSTEKMREEFEEWARQMSMDLEYRNIPGVGKFYECPRTLLALEAWKASRAAIEVELPGCEVDIDPDHEDYEVMEQQECLAMLESHTLTRCRKAIESLGLTVKV